MPGGEKRAFKVELKALSFWCSQLHLQDQFGLERWWDYLKLVVGASASTWFRWSELTQVPCPDGGTLR